VARNRPYAGGHITERYGAPELGCHALQLELRRGLFMHETTHEPHAGFAALQEILAALVHGLIEAVQQLLPASAARPPVPAGHAAVAAAGEALALRIA
jgi:N-formylglutamate amidohydrolase